MELKLIILVVVVITAAAGITFADVVPEFDLLCKIMECTPEEAK